MKKQYVVEVVMTTTVFVDAETEDEAIEQAGAIAWEYDPDKITFAVVDSYRI